MKAHFMKNNINGSRNTEAVKKVIGRYPNGVKPKVVGDILGITSCAVINSIICCTDIAEDDKSNLFLVRW